MSFCQSLRDLGCNCFCVNWFGVQNSVRSYSLLQSQIMKERESDPDAYEPFLEKKPIVSFVNIHIQEASPTLQQSMMIENPLPEKMFLHPQAESVILENELENDNYNTNND